MNSYSLHLQMQLKESQLLLSGLLELHCEGKKVNAYKATSSLAGRQYPGSWELKGGPIPPGNKYTVKLNPLWMPNVRGVEGSFYEIAPFEVPTNGATRGDFGVHFDANVPGSLGCVVLSTQTGWDAFRRDAKMITTKGATSVPLAVVYT
jgi:hypothetical protein